MRFATLVILYAFCALHLAFGMSRLVTAPAHAVANWSLVRRPLVLVTAGGKAVALGAVGAPPARRP